MHECARNPHPRSTSTPPTLHCHQASQAIIEMKSSGWFEDSSHALCLPSIFAAPHYCAANGGLQVARLLSSKSETEKLSLLKVVSHFGVV